MRNVHSHVVYPCTPSIYYFVVYCLLVVYTENRHKVPLVYHRKSVHCILSAD